MNDTKTGWRAQAFAGGFLLLIAAGANAADILNNWSYGSQTSTQLGLILVAFAAAVVAIPTAAGISGWGAHRKLYIVALAFCVAVTAYSSWKAYATKHDAAILTTENRQDAYNAAEASAKEARAMLKTLPAEAGTVEGLQAELATAQEKFDACTRWCSDVTKARDTLQTRLGNARARDKWQAKLDKAQAEMKAEGRAKFATDKAEQERMITQAGDLVIILGTQLLALLAGPGAGMIGSALRSRPQETVAMAPKVRRKPARREAVLAAYDKLSGLSHTKAAEHLKVAPATLKRWLEAREGERAAREALEASGKVARLQHA